MPQTTSDFREVSAGPLPFLEDLLWEWIALHERTARHWLFKDCLWWVNERASIGALAGAVWRVGGVAIEEYTTQKLARDESSRSAANAHGRGDMDFTLGGMDFVIEAKQCWTSFKDASIQIEENLAEAEADVRLAKSPVRYRRLAIVFVTPRTARTNLIDEQISTWVDSLHRIKRCAWACVFPARARMLGLRQYGKVYPGAAIFMRSVSSIGHK
jgi:hypothetical protein